MLFNRIALMPFVILAIHSYAYSTQYLVSNVSCIHDGIGAQFRRLISAMFYAEAHNHPFVYSPLECVDHNYDNDPEFLQKKEWLLNIKDHYPELCDEHKATRLVLIDIRSVTYMNQHMQAFSESETLKSVKALFRENKNRNAYRDDNTFIIALHFRRHNQADSRIMGTDLPDDYYVAVLNGLREQYQDKNPQFHIYSQGKLEDFSQFNAPDVVLHLNDSVENSFIGMAFADVLVISASTFGYGAGLLSEGTVYYIPSWCYPLQHWKSTAELPGVILPYEVNEYVKYDLL